MCCYAFYVATHFYKIEHNFSLSAEEKKFGPIFKDL
jgi:hypothetical protein